MCLEVYRCVLAAVEGQTGIGGIPVCVTPHLYADANRTRREAIVAEAPSYTTVPGRIPDLLRKIRETGVPPKATYEWLKTLGFTSSNDRSLIAVLRQIGFIDANGVPLPAWREYRGADHRAVLGRAVKLGYESLYATYPDAHVRSNTDLGHVFSTRTNAGKQVIDKMVATFKNLAKEAAFGPAPASIDASLIADTEGRAAMADEEIGSGTAGVAALPHATAKGGVTINVNVQLTLPETTDEKVFDAFFSAMRKHLLTDDVM